MGKLGYKKKIEMIDNIVDNIDFEKIHKVMMYLGWGWVNNKFELSIPSVDELKIQVKSLCFECFERHEANMEYDSYVIATGGFYVRTYHIEDENYWEVRASFELDNWSSDNETNNG